MGFGKKDCQRRVRNKDRQAAALSNLAVSSSHPEEKHTQVHNYSCCTAVGISDVKSEDGLQLFDTAK